MTAGLAALGFFVSAGWGFNFGAWLGRRRGRIDRRLQEELIFSQRTLIISLGRRAGIDLTDLAWYKEHVQRLDERAKEKK